MVPNRAFHNAMVPCMQGAIQTEFLENLPIPWGSVDARVQVLYAEKRHITRAPVECIREGLQTPRCAGENSPDTSVLYTTSTNDSVTTFTLPFAINNTTIMYAMGGLILLGVVILATGRHND